MNICQMNEMNGIPQIWIQILVCPTIIGEIGETFITSAHLSFLLRKMRTTRSLGIT